MSIEEKATLSCGDETEDDGIRREQMK